MDKKKRIRKPQITRQTNRSRPARLTKAMTGRHDLSKLGVPSSRLQRLAKAIAEAPASPKPMSLSHDECEALLEFYVDSERQGERVQTAYPTVWRHLQECDRCRLSYTLLADSLREAFEESSLDLSTPPVPMLSFLTPTPPDAIWTKYAYSRVGDGPFGFGFAISPSHLARVVAQLPSFAVRGQITARRSLLLLDSIALGSRNVQVGLWLHRSENPDYARLEVSVVSSSPLPEPLRARLSWNDHQYSSPVEQGQGWIDQIPVAELKNAHIRIEFEAGQRGTSTEG